MVQLSVITKEKASDFNLNQGHLEREINVDQDVLLVRSNIKVPNKCANVQTFDECHFMTVMC